MKIWLWITVCVVSAFSLFFRVLVETYEMLSDVSSLLVTGLYPWFVMFVCLVFLYLNKGRVLAEIEKAVGFIPSLAYASLGSFLCCASTLLFWLFNSAEIPLKISFVLLFYLGVFMIFFGEASAIPTILLCVYFFSVISPLFVQTFLEIPFSMASILLVVPVLWIFGIPAQFHDTLISFPSAHGENMTVFIDSRCAGSVSLTVFIALFILMYMDLPLPKREASKFLALGTVGTFLQNILRLASLCIAGYHYGYSALWQVHTYAGYIIFGVYFTIFSYLYITAAKASRRPNA